MLVAQDQVGVVDAELLGVPVLDQAVEHVEVVRKVDDARRVAVGKRIGTVRVNAPAGGTNRSCFISSAHSDDGLRRYCPFAGV